MPRVVHDRLALASLAKSFTVIPETQVSVLVSCAKARISEALALADEYKVLHPKQIEYVKCLFEAYKIPKARILVKVHKPTLECRIIAACTAWVTTPAAVLLSVILQDCVNDLPGVARDTSHVVEQLHSFDDSNVSDLNISSFDVDALYPSISQLRALHAIRLAFTDFVRRKRKPQWGVLVEVVMGLLEAILASQVVTFVTANGGKIWYQQTSGISTGLAVGSQIANLFMHGFDEYVKSNLGSNIALYTRYIDDVLIAHVAGVLSFIVELMNCWDDDISVSHDDSENAQSTTFLDLSIAVRASFFSYSTFRKPMNKYQYLPYDSNHSKQTKHGIISTELVRLIRTNRTCDDFERQVDFFVLKLRARGYDPVVIRETIDRHVWTSFKDRHACPYNGPSVVQQIVPFKIVFSPVVESLRIGAVLRRYRYLLPDDFNKSHRIVQCFKSAPSLFRLRYGRLFRAGVCRNTGII